VILIGIFLALLFFYSLSSGRLEKTVITAPIVFTGAGLLAQLFLPGLEKTLTNNEVFLYVSEIGLVLLLFTDASRTDLSVLKDIRNLSLRLLSTGMLLTILLGALAAKLIFPQFSISEAGILGAILAPTDAGLGQVIVNSPRVPMHIRQALNVEAGLNDGLSVPFLLFFIALSGAASGAAGGSLPGFLWEQLGLGTAIGLGIGLCGGWLLDLAERRKTISHGFRQLGLVTLPLLCAIVSEATHASMFIAAFVAGLAVQVKFKGAGKEIVEFTEDWGQLINLSVFFVFGLLAAHGWVAFRPSHVLYAVLSLTLIRMLPVAIALIGAGLSRFAVAFIGWFGPRGLASIVLGLVYLEHTAHEPDQDTIRVAVMVTVLMSIFAHGLSAMPGINFLCAKSGNLEAETATQRAIAP
jgi:NhaP-type Na+/H+ or K+/H+ antiporter